MPPRSDHWLQRSARARRLSRDSAPRSFPVSDDAGVPSCARVSPRAFPASPALTGAQRQPQQHRSPAPLGLEERGEAGAHAQRPAVPGEHPAAQAVHRHIGHLRGRGGGEVRPVPTRSLWSPDKAPALSPGAGAHLPAEAALSEGVNGLVGRRPRRRQQVLHPAPQQRPRERRHRPQQRPGDSEGTGEGGSGDSEGSGEGGQWHRVLSVPQSRGQLVKGPADVQEAVPGGRVVPGDGQDVTIQTELRDLRGHGGRGHSAGHRTCPGAASTRPTQGPCGPQDSPRDPVDPRTHRGTPQSHPQTLQPAGPLWHPKPSPRDPPDPSTHPGTLRIPAPTQGPPKPQEPRSAPSGPPYHVQRVGSHRPPGPDAPGPVLEHGPVGGAGALQPPPQAGAGLQQQHLGTARSPRGLRGSRCPPPKSRTLPALTLGGLGPRAKW